LILSAMSQQLTSVHWLVAPPCTDVSCLVRADKNHETQISDYIISTKIFHELVAHAHFSKWLKTVSDVRLAK